ncbi:MAG: uroporphyrinogen-III C-methyltransferase [Alphaproteobacteria bacterium]|jgi:uroporphyrin-III C-methyltransferase/precorrin-2 dehydrogenase/sirohydrochlorin ferrochelatase/uroporphyrin-III C-methyltransferase|nr:uroporphyrinogen-III C-methyltransferase [Alphaproteobacteria bacterium]HJP20599.1 uroporphyrinogen-III C-methyltransferase [Alphaproteobacteria bacterium]
MSNSGTVYLVGAGPGDPELLTLKALRLIDSADVVVYDRLVAPEILAIIPPGATRIYAGKASGRHHLPQDEINALLLKLARAGRRVVRLKGGDPFIFGRGSEEVEFLAEAGVRFEVVPGISAASGCASYLGIPLTHRGLASGVRFVTGHARDDRELNLDWQGLADIDTTLVIYMGLGQLAEISRRLIAAGLPASTPAAAIERGTTAAQCRTLATLEELPAAAAGLQPPTLIVIGRVVSLAGALDWFEADSDTEESGDVAVRA